MPSQRLNKEGAFRSQWESNRKKIIATADTCGICGQPLDKSKRYPHPMSTVVDHIIPLDKGGHPTSLDNLQAAHRSCNRAKSNKIWIASEKPASPQSSKGVDNKNLPLTYDYVDIFRAQNGGA